MGLMRLFCPVMSASLAAAVLLSEACAAPLTLTEAVIDGPQQPYVGELLLLRLRSFIGATVAAHEIIQPDLINFDWRQFGRDVEVTATIKGVAVPGIERVIAIFPRSAGAVTIGPFTRRATLIQPDDSRVETQFSSPPITLTALSHEGVGRPGAWWLPARMVTLADQWEPRPDRLGLNETARRTLTIVAAGLTADRLPPPPVMRAPGVIVFAAPPERRTLDTDAGPVAQAIYRYDIRPVSGDPAKMPAIRVPWFDTIERRMREAALGEQTVAFVDPTARPLAAREAGGGAPSWPLATAAALAGFVWTAALAALVLGAPRRGAFWRDPARPRLAALRRAARSGDGSVFRAATLALARSDEPRWREVAAEGDVAAGLAALDARLYGRDGERIGSPSRRELARLAADIAARWRHHALHECDPAI